MRTSDFYYGRAIIAALVATIAVALLVIIKDYLNYMPDINPAGLMGAPFGRADYAIGWPVHFIGGSLIGGAIFAWLSPYLPGPLAVRGMLFGVLAWLVMMVIGMPMAGYGFFGMNYAAAAPAMTDGTMVVNNNLLPIATLILQLIYGFVLGSTYSQLILQNSMAPGKHGADTLANANPARQAYDQRA